MHLQRCFFFSLSLVRYHSPSICLEIDLWSSIIIQIVFHMNPYDPFLTQQKVSIYHSGLGILISLIKQPPFSGASRWFSGDFYTDCFLGEWIHLRYFPPMPTPPPQEMTALIKGLWCFSHHHPLIRLVVSLGKKGALARLGPLEFPM